MTAVKGADKLKVTAAKLKKLQKAFADEMLKRVQDKSPTDTGLLKASWVCSVKDGVIELRNTAKDEQGTFYTPFVEYGTIHMPGQFMLNSTIAESADILKVAKKNVGL